MSRFSAQTLPSSLPVNLSPNRNVIINGAMQVAQRGTSTASITTGGYYTADRYNLSISSLGTWTQSVENDAPTGSGLRKSLKLNCTTADASPAAGDYMLIEHRLEGQNVQRFLKGTASAKQFTLSFWVKSNVTGTYIVELLDIDNGRQVSASYTVSASATWEKKTITFPADTTGAFDNDNAYSLSADFFLGLGSNFTSGTLNTSWASTTNANRGVGQTNLAAAINNYWQITGVQLEAGSVATPFEFEDYGVTLAKCQRYYQRITSNGSYNTLGFRGKANSTTVINGERDLPVQMRTIPNSVEISNAGWVSTWGGGVTAITAVAINNGAGSVGTNQDSIVLDFTTTSVSSGTSYIVIANGSASAYIGFGAEL